MFDAMKGGDGHGRQEPHTREVAITEADFLRGQLRAFRRRVERALEVIAGAARPVGISFSGGKDSTVLLHLVRRVWPDTPAGWFDSGAELQDTRDLMALTPNIQTYPAAGGGLIQLCKDHGYWGHVAEVEDRSDIDFNKALIDAPAWEFASHNALATVAIGLRAQESVTRRIIARQRGEYYQVAGGLYHLCPLMWWTDDEIWAYIASERVPYNRAYDKMAAMGIPRGQWRVSTVLGTAAASFGRFVCLKRIDPELWNRLAAEFPLVRKYV